MLWFHFWEAVGSFHHLNWNKWAAGVKTLWDKVLYIVILKKIYWGCNLDWLVCETTLESKIFNLAQIVQSVYLWPRALIYSTHHMILTMCLIWRKTDVIKWIISDTQQALPCMAVPFLFVFYSPEQHCTALVSCVLLCKNYNMLIAFSYKSAEFISNMTFLSALEDERHGCVEVRHIISELWQALHQHNKETKQDKENLCPLSDQSESCFSFPLILSIYLKKSVWFLFWSQMFIVGDDR